MITAAHVTAAVTSVGIGHLVALGWLGWTDYAVLAYRTVLAHAAVLVEVAKRRRGERRRFAASPIGEPAKRPGWDDDPDTLRDMPVVFDPDSTGRHSKGSVA